MPSPFPGMAPWLHVFNRAYDAGPYRRGALDYASPPHPTLSDADYAWARQRLEAK